VKPSVGMTLSPTSTFRPESTPAAVVMALSASEKTSVTRPVMIQSPFLGISQAAGLCARAGAAKAAAATAERIRVFSFILLIPDARCRLMRLVRAS